VRLTDFHRTTGFRLATLFLAMFGIVSVLLFGYLYIEITGFEMERVDNWLIREHAELARQAPADLAARFERQSLHDPRLERPSALFDANGKHLAGGYQGDFPAVPYFNRPFSIRLALNGKHPPGRCIAMQIPDRRTTLLCENIRGLDHFDEELLRALLSAAVAMLMVGLVGAVIVGVGSVRRLDTVTASIQEIVAGNLSRRLPTRASNDEFDRLVRVVNGMLDEIERLMHEVKGVCDAIAHDLRTPLTRLMAGLERAQRRARSEEDHRHAIDKAIIEIGGILRTFNALLRISEIESGMRREMFGPVDLAAVARDVVEFYEPAAEDKEIVLRYLGAPGQPFVMQGDPSLLFEALANLVENAVKFAPRNGHVQVELKRDDAGLHLTVSDDGPGIVPEERQAVLRRFYRGEASRHTPGSGLGLSLAFAVVGMHGMSMRFNDVPSGCAVEFLLASDSRPGLLHSTDSPGSDRYAR
jgi:signal transduction histidine kinase